MLLRYLIQIKPFLLSFMSVFWLISCQTIQVAQTSDTEKLEKNRFIYKQRPLTEEQKKQWWAMNMYSDSIPGINIKQVNEFLKGKTNTPITVAVIDSGIDIKHPSLKEHVWINLADTPGNGHDDDDNGFIDDQHGWNFLGEITGAPLALTRMVRALEEKFEGKVFDEISINEKRDFERYQLLKTVYEKESNEASDAYANLSSWYDEEQASTQLKSYYHHILSQNQYHYNVYFDPREVIGDNVHSQQYSGYGNPNVLPLRKEEHHGTHVAGIIASVLKEISGTNFRLMSIRSTPDGDEYDKDVALAIRYAVDNGAKVINMSFGKAYSEHPDWVYDAMAYAADKDVLIVQAAGNNAQNLDEVMSFPNDHKGQDEEFVDNVITVGAITRYYNELLVSPFSNYGSRNVDIFAPGSDIYSAIPGEQFKFDQGTSMAAPMITGIAASIRAYFPELSAEQVKAVIIESGFKVSHPTIIPGSQNELRTLDKMCVSGGIADAYSSFLLAEVFANRMAKN